MNIILLSGGSGKRLWPLSNEIRSKQFLKLLKNDKNEYESMVQRVYRQIREAKIDAPIVLATGSAQEDLIKSQLGNEVSIVSEPKRRNTFPAILLSSAFLALKKGIDLDETVIVLPVDPFAELEYFNTLNKMDEIVQSGISDLVLMGIKPTYPSAKYGYIMPCVKNSENSYKVEKFIEKPSEDKAAELIKSGAVWNGGVFAFKLSWIMEILSKNMKVNNFEELYNRYDELNKDSFDYQVVERANSISMVLYNGIWKDLGTWNTLTEEMKDETVGNVITGEGTVGTSVINELNIPLVVLGAKDMVITASPDGILVSDKNKSSYIKPYVEKLGERPMYAECSWGEYHIIDYSTYDNGHKSVTKKLKISENSKTSYHLHKLHDEIWTFLSGTGEVMIDGHLRSVKAGDTVYITAGTKHAIHAYAKLDFVEVQIGEEVSEDDKKCFDIKW